MKKLIFLISLLYWIFLFHCATEQKAISPAYTPQEKCDGPAWNVGNTWRYRYSDMKEWQYTVERIEGNLYIFEDRYGPDKPCFDKKNLEMVAYINLDGKKVKLRAPSIFYIDFPIYEGKKWKKMVSGTPLRGATEINYLNEFQVISYEDVNVPAGTFKAFKIELKQTNYGGQFATGKVYLWYSPEVKFYIKVVFDKIPYWIGTLDSILISYNLKKEESPPSEIK